MGEIQIYNAVNKYVNYEFKIVTNSLIIRLVPLRSIVMFGLEGYISSLGFNGSNVVNAVSLRSRTISCKDKQGKIHKNVHKTEITYNSEKNCSDAPTPSFCSCFC